MSNNVVAKMQVWSKAPNANSREGMIMVGLGAVYRDIKENPEDENAIFGQATPVASCNMGIVNPAAVDFFEPGVEYYVTFTRVPGSKSYAEKQAELEAAVDSSESV